jgi:serine/threonine protein kinase
MPAQYADLYHAEGLLYRGGFAEIWRASGPDGKVVAIKRLRLDKLRDRAAVRSIYHEARMATGLDHPNVVRALNFLPGPPFPTLVMEYFPSRNLKVRILDRRGDRLLTSRCSDILQQMAQALLYVHERGIIHMDIKPENFLLSDDGWVKVTDFALSATAARSWRRFLPGPRHIAGTLPYIAPETLRRRHPDFRTDIYSFGATVFELLTRRPPFITSDRDELPSMHLHQPPPWPWTYNKNLTREVNDFVLAMLEKDPGRRPQTMLDVATRLKRIRIFEKAPAEEAPAEEAPR